MWFYVIAFAVTIVSTPVLVASTPINHPWHDVVTPQRLSSWSETPANLEPLKASSENELPLGDYIHTDSDYYLSDVDEGEAVDVGVYHQPALPKPIGQNDKLQTVPLPDDRAHDSTLYLPTHQDKSDMDDDKDSNHLMEAASASTHGSSPASLSVVDVIHRTLDAKGHQKPLATNDLQVNSIPGHTNHPTVPPQRPKVGKPSTDTSVNGLITFYRSKVKENLEALTHEEPDSTNVANYILATNNPPPRHCSEQEPSNIICLVFWSVRDEKFSSHCERILKVEPHPVSEYAQYLVEKWPMMITKRVWSVQDISKLISSLEQHTGYWNGEFKSNNQAGLNELTRRFRQKYIQLILDDKKYVLLPSPQDPPTSKFRNDLVRKLDSVSYVDPRPISDDNLETWKWSCLIKP